MADGVLQYIGARYVPTFYLNSAGTPEWRPGVAFEPLTIVTWNNNSYTSRKPVPAEIGEPSTNPEYWAQTGVYNAQIGQLQNDVADLQSAVSDLNEVAESVYWTTPEEFGAVGDGVTDDSAAFQTMLNTIDQNTTVVCSKDTYLIKTGLVCRQNFIKFTGGFATSEGWSQLKTDVENVTIMTVYGTGCHFDKLLFVGEGTQATVQQMGLVFDMDNTQYSGNIDAVIKDCGFVNLYRGVTAKGRNITFKNNIFSVCTAAIELLNTLINTSNRGYWIMGNRFHVCTACIRNMLDHSLGHNVVIDSNFADYSTNFYFGTAENVFITNNKIVYAQQYANACIAVNKSTANTTDTYMEISGNDFISAAVSAPDGNAVVLRDCLVINEGVKAVVIKNNLFSGYGQFAMRIFAAEQIDVLNNIISNCQNTVQSQYVIQSNATSGSVAFNRFTGGNTATQIYAPSMTVSNNI